MKNKGFLLTFDAFLALMLLGVVMLMVISESYEDNASDSRSMRSFSMDMLASFEKSGLFSRSLDNATALRLALNSLPPNVCVQLTITDSTNATLADLQNEGCGNPNGAYVLFRTFYARGELYLAKSRTWPK